MRTSRALVTATIALGSFAACGDDGGGSSAADDPNVVVDDADAVIVSENLQFDPTEIELPAGEQVTIAHANRDDGTAHNIHLVDVPGEPKTELETGPRTDLLEVTLEPGDHQVICDLHPSMRATIRAV